MADGKNFNQLRKVLITYNRKLIDVDIKVFMNLEVVDRSCLYYLKTVKETLRKNLNRILEIDQILGERIENDEEFYEFFHKSMDYEVNIMLEMTKIDTFITNYGNISRNVQIQTNFDLVKNFKTEMKTREEEITLTHETTGDNSSNEFCKNFKMEEKSFVCLESGTSKQSVNEMCSIVEDDYEEKDNELEIKSPIKPKDEKGTIKERTSVKESDKKENDDEIVTSAVTQNDNAHNDEKAFESEENEFNVVFLNNALSFEAAPWEGDDYFMLTEEPLVIETSYNELLPFSTHYIRVKEDTNFYT